MPVDTKSSNAIAPAAEPAQAPDTNHAELLAAARREVARAAIATVEAQPESAPNPEVKIAAAPIVPVDPATIVHPVRSILPGQRAGSEYKPHELLKSGEKLVKFQLPKAIRLLQPDRSSILFEAGVNHTPEHLTEDDYLKRCGGFVIPEPAQMVLAPTLPGRADLIAPMPRK